MKRIYGCLPVFILLVGCSLPLKAVPATAENTLPPAGTLSPSGAATPPSHPTIAPTQQDFPPITLTNANAVQETASMPLENTSLLVWLPESKTLAASGAGKILLLDGRRLSVLQEYAIPENTSLLDFNPASQRMALTTDRRTVAIRDLSGKEIQTISLTAGFDSAGFDPDGRQIWFSSLEEFKASAYDVETGKEITSCGGFETAAPVYSVFPSPQGKWLVWRARATLQLNNLADCQTAARISHEDFIISHAFNKDESILATSTGGTANGEFLPLIFLWDAGTGNPVGKIILKESPARSLSFSPDGALLVSAGSGLFIWDVAAGKEIKKLAPVEQSYLAAAISPDGKTLAAATETELHLFAVKP